MLWEESTHRRRLEEAAAVRARAAHRFPAVGELLRAAYALCRRMQLSLSIFTTAAMYLLRYYCRAAHDVAGDSQCVLTSVIYVAMKAHDAPYTLNGYIDMLTDHLAGVDRSTVVAYELDVLESINFDVVVHSPFRVTEVLCKEAADASNNHEADGLCHLLGRVVQEAAALLCIPPVQLVAAPQIIALCAAAYVAEAADDEGALRRLIAGTRTAQRLAAADVGMAQAASVFASASMFYLTCLSPPGEEGEGDEDEAVDSLPRLPKHVVEMIAGYLPRTCVGNLRATCRDYWNALGKAYWTGYHIAGLLKHPPAERILALHPGELRLLRLAGLARAHTGAAAIHSHTFSAAALAVLREMGADGIKLPHCHPGAIEPAAG